MLKVLWVTAHAPDPDSTGTAGDEARLLAELARTHDVEVLAADRPEGTTVVELGTASVPVSGASWRVRRGLASRLAYPVDILWSSPAPDALSSERLRALAAGVVFHAARRRIDVVHLHGVELASVAGATDAPAVAFVDGLLSAEHTGRRIKAWERRWLDRCASVVTTSAAVAAELRHATSTPVQLLEAEHTADALANCWSDVADARVRHDDDAASVTSTNGRPSASIVVCTKDRADLLERSLPILAERTRGGDVDLVIVEQGDSRAADLCRALGVRATIVHDRGVGAARARNIGVAHCTGDVVLFTDDDCEVPPTWVDDHLRALGEDGVDASFGVVHGLSQFGDADDYDVTHDAVFRRAVHHLGSPPWLVGHSANMAIRRPAFVRLGGFDERLGPGSRGAFIGEDADLIVRLLRFGAAVSGTGEPVAHIDWRSTEDTNRTLVSYERGSGAWIGKLVRADRRLGMHFLRARADMLRVRVRHHPGLFHEPKLVLLSLAGFGRGLLFGARLRPWLPSGVPSVSVEHVGEGDDSRVDGYFLASQTIGVTCAVPTFMMS